MSNLQFTQTKIQYGLLLLLIIAIGMTACGGASTPSPAVQKAVEVERLVDPAAEKPAPAEQPAAEEGAADAEPQQGEAETGNNLSPVTNRPNPYNRLIIKNAEVNLLVENTDVAIDRSLGIVTEYGGYVISNRTWFDNEFKYATLTIGVPSENFEQMLRRLKDLAITVTDETASGQDVTDEYVDLKSRLTNLEATAARIRTFLEQATTVEESLTVSKQLSDIEAEIEQVKGRMAYLKDRAAFSTITLQISPQIPTPTPMPSPTPTMTPTPTPTPVPWTPGQTFDKATDVTSTAARSLFQVTVDTFIWVVIVILPFTLPIVAVVWLVAWLARRSGKNQTPPSVL